MVCLAGPLRAFQHGDAEPLDFGVTVTLLGLHSHTAGVWVLVQLHDVGWVLKLLKLCLLICAMGVVRALVSQDSPWKESMSPELA